MTGVKISLRNISKYIIRYFDPGVNIWGGGGGGGGCQNIVSHPVRRYFDPHDILTPGSKYRNDILTPPYDILTSPMIINDKVLFSFHIYLIRYVI